jgi:hypothetical protein
MSTNNWFFHWQAVGGEDEWRLDLAANREAIVAQKRPAFVTVLDLSSVPDDGDWSKTHYRGPLYFDFDADGDLPLACSQLQVFLGKLVAEFDFDLSQARLFASGGKGFHVEIPAECVLPKVPPNGIAWLPYIYRAMAEKMFVETMDMRVYTGKRGRMWRTPGVQRDNGNYKVQLNVEQAIGIDETSYLDLVSRPSPVLATTPPFCNSKLAMLFQQAKDNVTTQMRGKKKRLEKANKFLEPWKRAGAHPPTIEMIMRGEKIREGAGFHPIALQLSIYATSVAMPLDEFLAKCEGLCRNHISDGRRYNTYEKRVAELARMWHYMESDSLYDYASEPIYALVEKGTSCPDLGVMDTEDLEDQPTKAATPVNRNEVDAEDGDVPAIPSDGSTPVEVVDAHQGVRKGFFMNAYGMWKRKEDGNNDSICRATLRKVEAFHDVESLEFKGYEFDIVVNGKVTSRVLLGGDAFQSAQSLRKFFIAHQLSYQGGEPETMALFDIMSEKASRGGRSYSYPREGFFIIDNPAAKGREPVKVYLTQDTYLSSVPEDAEDHFKLRYKNGMAASSYNIDIHRAPELCEDHVDVLHSLFAFNKDDVVADMVGWFVACHYRSVYGYLFNQFPLLQVYGEAGSGKSQTVLALAQMHWYLTPISVKSALSCTPFAMDVHASTSTSAPFILDEFKPRELKRTANRYEKIKDVFKAAYLGGDIGERGTVNKGAESQLAIIKSKATAPIVFMGEAIEMETAIIERSVSVNCSKAYHTKERTRHFNNISDNPEALSALGRELVEMGFALNLQSMKKEVRALYAQIEATLPDHDDAVQKRAAPRMIFNRAIVLHGLQTLKAVLQRRFGPEFDADIDRLVASKSNESSAEYAAVQMHSMSEISKVVNRLALLSRDTDVPWKLNEGTDYLSMDGWIEIKVERSYDCYRRYCHAIGDTPLFDNVDQFRWALAAYSPVVDRICPSSALRTEGSQEKIVRMDLRALRKEGVQTFFTR